MEPTATKAVAARVPFTEYIRILTAATEAKLSVSDYLIMKLSAPDRLAQVEDQLVQAKQALHQAKLVNQELAKKNQELTQELTQSRLQTANWKQHAESLLHREAELSKKSTQQISQIASLNRDNTQLQSTNSANQQKVNHLESELAKLKQAAKAMRADLVETYNSRGGFNRGMKDEYWVIVDEFVDKIK